MTTPIVLIAVFVLVYACTASALEHTEFREARFVLALPVGVLCVLGLLRGGEHAQDSPMIDTVLIPYAALAYFLIFIIILWLLSRVHLWTQKSLRNRQIRKTSRDRGIASKKNALARLKQESENAAIKK